MPLEVRDLRAREEDILTGACCRPLLFDLQFHDVRWMLDDLVNVGPVPRTNFAEDTLKDPDNATNEPVALLRCQCTNNKDGR